MRRVETKWFIPNISDSGEAMPRDREREVVKLREGTRGGQLLSRIIPSNNIEIINISKCYEKWTQDEDDLNSCMAVFFLFIEKVAIYSSAFIPIAIYFVVIYSPRHLFRRHLFPSPFIPSLIISR